MLKTWLLNIVIFNCFFHGSMQTGLVESTLSKKIFAGYTNDIRPQPNVQSGRTRVNISVKITQILNIDEKNEILSLLAWVVMQWEDMTFTWDPGAYGNLRKLTFPASDIWIPDVILYNTDDIDMGFHLGLPRDDEDQHFFATATANGSVLLGFPQVFKSACKLNIGEYPFDEQKCMLHFGSWSHNSDELEISIVKNKIVKEEIFYITNKAWQQTGSYCTTSNQRCSFDFANNCSVASCTIQLKRTAWFEVISYTLPTIVIAVLSLMVFMVPPEAGKRMEVGITLILCIAVYLSLINKKMPSTSESFPLVSQFYGCIIVEITIAMVCSCFCLHIYDPEGLRLLHFPNYLRTLGFGIIARVICYKSDGGKISRVHPTSKVDKIDVARRRKSTFKSNGDVFFVKSSDSQSPRHVAMRKDFSVKMEDIEEHDEHTINNNHNKELNNKLYEKEPSDVEKSKVVKVESKRNKDLEKNNERKVVLLKENGPRENEPKKQLEAPTRKESNKECKKDKAMSNRKDSKDVFIKSEKGDNRKESQGQLKEKRRPSGNAVMELDKESRKSDIKQDDKRKTLKDSTDSCSKDTKKRDKKEDKRSDNKEHRNANKDDTKGSGSKENAEKSCNKEDKEDKKSNNKGNTKRDRNKELRNANKDDTRGSESKENAVKLGNKDDSNAYKDAAKVGVKIEDTKKSDNKKDAREKMTKQESKEKITKDDSKENINKENRKKTEVTDHKVGEETSAVINEKDKSRKVSKQKTRNENVSNQENSKEVDKSNISDEKTEISYQRNSKSEDKNSEEKDERNNEVKGEQSSASNNDGVKEKKISNGENNKKSEVNKEENVGIATASPQEESTENKDERETESHGENINQSMTVNQSNNNENIEEIPLQEAFQARSDAVLIDADAENIQGNIEGEPRCDSGFGELDGRVLLSNRSSLNSIASVQLQNESSTSQSDSVEEITLNSMENQPVSERQDDVGDILSFNRAVTIPLCGRSAGDFEIRVAGMARVASTLVKSKHGLVPKSITARPYTDSVLRRWPAKHYSKSRLKSDLQIKKMLFAEIESQSEIEEESTRNSNAEESKLKEVKEEQNQTEQNEKQTLNTPKPQQPTQKRRSSESSVVRRKLSTHNSEVEIVLPTEEAHVDEVCYDVPCTEVIHVASKESNEHEHKKDNNDQHVTDTRDLFARRNWGIVKKKVQKRFTVQELFGQILSPKETNPIIAIANVVTRDQRRFVMRTEWMTSAMIFNRFFIILLALAVFISVLAVFMQSSRLRSL